MIKVAGDITLLSFPNKDVDMPSMGACVLTAVLKEGGFDAMQQDHNVLLRDMFLTRKNLEHLATAVLPDLWRYNLNNSGAASGLTRTIKLLKRIEEERSLGALEAVKQKLQARDYKEVFCDAGNAAALEDALSVLLRAYQFFDLVVSNPLVEKEHQDLFVFRHMDLLVDAIVAKQPIAVGLHLTSFERLFSLWFARRLKERGFEGKIIAGGPDVTYFKDAYLREFPFLDFLVYQEGEVALPTLLTSLRDGKQQIEGIENLIFRTDGQKVKVNPPFIFKTQPYFVPDFTDLPLNKYITGTLPVQASRGCTWALCTFCKHFRTYAQDYYEQPPKTTVDVIETLKKRHGTTMFHFTDDDFPLALKNQVAQDIIDRGLDVRFLSYSRFDPRITKEMLQQWFDAGFVCMEWGLESGSQPVLTKIKKGTNLKVAQRLLLDAADVGMLNKTLMFHNLPGESYEDLELSLRFLREAVMRGVVRPFYEIRTPLELLIGTPLYQETFNTPNYGNNFKKAWQPRGPFIAQCGYASNEDYIIKSRMLSHFVMEMQARLKPYKILEMNDEAIMLDVIIEELVRNGHEPQLRTRAAYPENMAARKVYART